MTVRGFIWKMVLWMVVFMVGVLTAATWARIESARSRARLLAYLHLPQDKEMAGYVTSAAEVDGYIACVWRPYKEATKSDATLVVATEDGRIIVTVEDSHTLGGAKSVYVDAAENVDVFLTADKEGLRKLLLTSRKGPGPARIEYYDRDGDGVFEWIEVNGEIFLRTPPGWVRGKRGRGEKDHAKVLMRRQGSWNEAQLEHGFYVSKDTSRSDVSDRQETKH